VSVRPGSPQARRAEPLASRGAEGLPPEFAPRRLLRRLLQVVALLAVIVLVALLAPGLGEVRERLGSAAPGWLAVAVALEALSCGSYVLMFRQVFCPRMSWRTSAEIAWAELAAGSLVPASGAAGLALGAWILHRGGMPADRIARRSVAFFLIKSSVNFVAVAALGTVMAVGLVGPDLSLLLTALPAVLSVTVIALVLAIPRLGLGRDPGPGASKLRRAVFAVRRALIGGTAEAVEIVRSRDLTVIAGAIGY
jgi:Lysylphosphatidylglycerol synthase TM region